MGLNDLYIYCKGAIGMVETDGRGRVITGAAEEVSYTGVRIVGSKITDTVSLIVPTKEVSEESLRNRSPKPKDTDKLELVEGSLDFLESSFASLAFLASA
ncbi:hypothetical protein Tco_0029917, partial [Tanacetum coccineum]